MSNYVDIFENSIIWHDWKEIRLKVDKVKSKNYKNHDVYLLKKIFPNCSPKRPR